MTETWAPPTPISRDEWLNHLDTLTADTTPGTVISEGYADGSIAGISLDYDAEEADDERGVIVGLPGDGVRWVATWDPQRCEWI